jgi:hypothetical protein
MQCAITVKWGEAIKVGVLLACMYSCVRPGLKDVCIMHVPQLVTTLIRRADLAYSTSTERTGRKCTAAR